jgi:hypothetical protein
MFAQPTLPGLGSDHDPTPWAIGAYAKTYGAKFPPGRRQITDDAEKLLAFYDFSA